MKHFFLKVWKTPMFLIFVLIALFYGLPSLGNPAEIDKFAVVTAVGIDLAEDEAYEYQVSLLTFIPIPEQTFTETYKVLTAYGNSIGEAIDYAGLYCGRQVGLSHIKTIVLSKQVLNEDVTNVLDYLIRDKEVSASTKLVATDASARDFLSAVQKLDSQSSITISEIVTYNENYIYATDSSLESFFKGYFSPTSASVVPVFSLQKNGNEGLSVENASGQSEGQSGGQGDAQGGGSSGGEQIINRGDTLVFKKGYLERELTGEEMVKINYFRGEFSTGAITIDNINEEPFENADLTFDVSDRKIRNKVVFENGIPVVYTDIKLSIVLSEVEQENGMFGENIDLYNISKSVTDKLENFIRREMSDAVAIMRETGVDIADFYTKIHNTDKKGFKKFLDSLENKEEYLNYVLFKANVRVNTK